MSDNDPQPGSDAVPTVEPEPPAAAPPQGQGGQQLTGEAGERQNRRDERWRDRARAAEARADRLAAREVLRLLGQRVPDAQVALAMSGEEVTDLLTEDGNVDEQAVADLADRMLTNHPTLAGPTHHLDLGPKTSPVRRHEASWGSVLRR